MHMKVIIRHLHRFWRRQTAQTVTGSIDQPGAFSIDTGTDAPQHVTISRPTSGLPFAPNPLRSFSPPSECTGDTYTLSPGGGDSYDGYLSIASRGPNSLCFPSEVQVITSGAVFSPGTCPDGYLTVAGGITSFNAEITYAVCCPPPLTLYTNTTGGSPSTLCNEDGLGADLATIIDGTATTTAYAAYHQADPLTVIWQSTDLDYLRRTSASTTASDVTSSALPESRSSTPPVTSTPAPVKPSTTIDTQRVSQGLPLGVQAGIGAGVAVAVVFILALALFMWRRLKSKAMTDDDGGDAFGKAELPGEGVHRELDNNNAVHEADPAGKPPEVDSVPCAELETDWAGWEAPTVTEVSLAPPSSEETDSTFQQSSSSEQRNGSRH